MGMLSAQACMIALVSVDHVSASCDMSSMIVQVHDSVACELIQHSLQQCAMHRDVLRPSVQKQAYSDDIGRM